MRRIACLCTAIALNAAVISQVFAQAQPDLFVTSGLSDEILRYDGLTGSFIETFIADGEGGLDGPDGFSLGPDGRLYVSSENSDEVLRFDALTGAFIDVFVSGGSGGLDTPVGNVFGPDGNLYVAGYGSDNVVRYDGDTGAFRDVFVPAGSGGLGNPSVLVFGPDRNLYVSSITTDAVVRYDGTTGEFLDEFVGSSSGGLTNPDGLVFGPDGDLYVSSQSTNQVLRFDGETGAFMGVFIGASEGLSLPLGLAFGSDAMMYVASANSDEVLRFDASTGDPIDVFVAAGLGGLDRPQAVRFSNICSDGVVNGSEQCDDGNLIAGDCCSPSCSFEPIGAACTDGKSCTAGDVCDGAGGCRGTPPAQCIDGNPCTQDLCDASGDCLNIAEPITTCRSSGRARFLVQDRDGTEKDRLKLALRKGTGLAQSDLGDPTSATTYSLCIYDETVGAASSSGSLSVPAGQGWLSKAPKGFLFKDKAGLNAGVRKVQMRTGTAGKSRVSWSARGSTASWPIPIGTGQFFEQDPKVTVQIVNDATPACWGVSFTGADARKNDGANFSAGTR